MKTYQLGMPRNTRYHMINIPTSRANTVVDSRVTGLVRVLFFRECSQTFGRLSKVWMAAGSEKSPD